MTSGDRLTSSAPASSSRRISTTAGAVLGIAFAIGLSVWLVNTFELPKLDWRYLPAGVIALWAVGQLAAYGPARRAAGIEPATATRSV